MVEVKIVESEPAQTPRAESFVWGKGVMYYVETPAISGFFSGVDKRILETIDEYFVETRGGYAALARDVGYNNYMNYYYEKIRGLERIGLIKMNLDEHKWELTNAGKAVLEAMRRAQWNQDRASLFALFQQKIAKMKKIRATQGAE